MSDELVPERPRQRAKRGERRCKYIYQPGDPDGEPGEVHGILLTPENSYATSVYCKTHHNRVMMENRKTSEKARASNIERTKRWQKNHPEKVAELKKASRKRLADGQNKHPTRGRPVVRSALPPPAPEPTPALPPPAPEPPAVEWVSGAFKAGQRYHLKGPNTMSECRQWRAAFNTEELPADDPRICAACLRNRRARKQSA